MASGYSSGNMMTGSLSMTVPDPSFVFGEVRINMDGVTYKDETVHDAGGVYKALVNAINGRAVSAISPVAAEQAAPKDHDVRQLVNDLRDIAVAFHGTGQLRERIAGAVTQFIGAHSGWKNAAARQATAAAPKEPSDFLMPENAWNEYATRSGLLNDSGVATDPAKTQAAYFAYMAAWNTLHKAFTVYIANKQHLIARQGTADLAPLAAPTDGARERDLARYQWLQQNHSVGTALAGCEAKPRRINVVRLPMLEGSTLDAAIDAASVESSPLGEA